MGTIVGGVVQGVGAVLGANAETSAAGKAATSANQGFNYLTGGAGGAPTSGYINAGQNALTGQATTQNALAGLLGTGGNPAQAAAAFNNYKNSTGYGFQLKQGTQAINTNAATSGMLDSGANLKALTGYGQNLASTTFNNYLGQLGGLNSMQGATAQMGQNSLGAVGTAGTQGGIAAGQNILAGGAAQGNMWAGLGGAAGNALGTAYGMGSNALAGQGMLPAGQGIFH